MDIPGIKLDFSSLAASRKPDPDENYDLLIVGGGPAAMSAAVYAARKMMNLALITKDYGGQMRDTSDIENYLGFQSIKAEELIENFVEHVQGFDIPVGREVSATGVKKDGELFRVSTDDGGSYAGRTLIIATGKRWRPLEVPGERELMGKGVATCAACDAPFFRDKRVVVAGGGNSGFTTALDLLKLNAEVTLVNFAKGWSADEILQQSLKKFDRVHLLDHHQVLAIEGEGKVKSVLVKDRGTDGEKRIEADGVFVEIGLLPNSEIAKGFLEINPAGEIEVDCACRTSVEGVFAAGDVTTVPYKQIIISSGEGAKAALAAYDYLALKGLI